MSCFYSQDCMHDAFGILLAGRSHLQRSISGTICMSHLRPNLILQTRSRCRGGEGWYITCSIGMHSVQGHGLHPVPRPAAYHLSWSPLACEVAEMPYAVAAKFACTNDIGVSRSHRCASLWLISRNPKALPFTWQEFNAQWLSNKP